MNTERGQRKTAKETNLLTPALNTKPGDETLDTDINL